MRGREGERDAGDRGFATSGAYLIVGVAAFIALGSLHAAVGNTAERVTEAGEDAREQRLAVAASEVTVGSATYDTATGRLTVEATNTGEWPLRVADTDLLADGRYVTGTTARIDGRTDPAVWRPGERLTLRADTAAPGRVKLVAEGGVADITRVTTV